MPELSTRFNFKEVEEKWCRWWEENSLFHAEPKDSQKPYSIVIPPPNVTGILHMGHALNNTLQDIMVRYKRMQGYETCWMPGTDHAGIATQNVVEKQLAKEGKTRFDIGREELLRLLWDWKKNYGDTIIKQLKRMGASCDWQRSRFTMDDPYSEAVKLVFIKLYEKGLIYRGEYIINWCPRCQTALSDEEVEHREIQGSLYYLKYPLKENPQKHVIVATTRPETMLGDTAVAVHPKDRRYKELKANTLVLPLLKRNLKVIEDDFVDPKFGTGVVKVTPAHDPNDFLLGKRHKLESINIMHPDATLNNHAGPYQGLDRFEARKRILEDLKDQNLLEKIEPHQHSVGHCYRCETIVEPYLSKQWFVKMAPLAQAAIQVVKEGKIKFYPARWKKVYLKWMEDIHDWCISRQIWWGHRIPVWYCQGDSQCQLNCREPIVASLPPTQCPHCGSKNLIQDEDVLDTWFSSWLWPFATFGWPAKNRDLKYFYPTCSLFTASEIIFFWVARMIMAGCEFMGEIPFREVYIHGTVRDAKGLKMSKSLGNAIDPLEIIKEYGADALRFSLIINSGQDVFISKDKFEIGRNFANKIWNATRLILMNINLDHREIDLDKDIKINQLDLPSQWIISRFYSNLKEVNRSIKEYRFSDAENRIYDFFWKNFCDWYLEIIKNKFSDPTIQKILTFILEQSIRLMHPFLPFVTEEIWLHLKVREGALAIQRWPELKKKLINPQIENQMDTIIEIITIIRNLKVRWNIKPQQDIDCFFSSPSKEQLALLNTNQEVLKFLLKIKNIHFGNQQKMIENSAQGMVGTIKFFFPLGEIIDIRRERERILKEIEEHKKAYQGIFQRLKDQAFIKKAPLEIIEKDKSRLVNLDLKIKELEEAIKNLN